MVSKDDSELQHLSALENIQIGVFFTATLRLSLQLSYSLKK